MQSECPYCGERLAGNPSFCLVRRQSHAFILTEDEDELTAADQSASNESELRPPCPTPPFEDDLPPL